ncbi:hypothetical protein SeMB42_g06197 [Synchytrium endobioticum]|uniref:Uncharacterized protein n=1 Tax=Synchytrium endobioticum TaxID=286115 RepID=A0A507CFP0_9FUNG|nr:hypothetical protein SeMB42_g06197 [Synchytrium endobioticum]TPX47060.1 hypothetical protein SeLEV6574_g02858 [Synchytrium endobioticum]
MTLDKPQIISHLSKPLSYTPHDTRWVPMSSRFIVVGQHARGTGCLAVHQLSHDGLTLSTQIEHPSAFKCATFAASATRSPATGHFNGLVTTWDLESGTAATTHRAHDQLVNCIDGCGGPGVAGPPELVTGSRDGSVKVWDVRQPVPVATMHGDRAPDVWTVAFGNAYTATDRCVAAGYANGDLVLFDLRSMGVRWTTNVGDGVCSVEFDRRDVRMNKMVVGALEGRVGVYDLRTLHPVHGFAGVAVKENDDATVWLIRHVPQDRDLFVSSGGAGALRLWRYAYPESRVRKEKGDEHSMGVAGTMEELQHAKVAEQPVNSFDWSPDKKGLCVFTAFDQTVRVGIVTKI